LLRGKGKKRFTPSKSHILRKFLEGSNVITLGGDEEFTPEIAGTATNRAKKIRIAS